jgi:hypothetical protein
MATESEDLGHDGAKVSIHLRCSAVMAHDLISAIDEVDENHSQTLPESAAVRAQAAAGKRNSVRSKRNQSFTLARQALKHKRSIEFCVNQANTILYFQLRHLDQSEQRPPCPHLRQRAPIAGRELLGSVSAHHHDMVIHHCRRPPAECCATSASSAIATAREVCPGMPVARSMPTPGHPSQLALFIFERVLPFHRAGTRLPSAATASLGFFRIDFLSPPSAAAAGSVTR